MRELQQKLSKKQRLARLDKWVEETETEALRLRQNKKASEAHKRSLAWQFAKALTEARTLKQPEMIGRLMVAFETLWWEGKESYSFRSSDLPKGAIFLRFYLGVREGIA